MLGRILFLGHHPVLNSPSKETASAGLGPSGQWIVILIALLLIGLWFYAANKKK